MTLKSKVLIFAAIAALAIGGTAVGQTLEVVTNIGGGGPGGQPEDPGCVREGSYAMRAESPLGDDTEVWVQADSNQGFNNETVLRQEFWLNLRDIVMENNARHFVATALPGGAGQRPVRAILKFRNSTGYSLAAQCARNCGSPPCSYQGSGNINVSGNGWNLIRLEWAHNTLPAPNPADGICRIEVIDGVDVGAMAERTNMRNTNHLVGRARLGLMGGILRTTTDGDHCFDSYQAFRTLASP